MALPKAPIIPPGLPGRIVRRLARRPVVVVSLAAVGYRVGKDAYKVSRGEMASEEFRTRAGGHVGAVSGGVMGATMGTVALSVIPGLGPILGGFVGGIVGEMGGQKLGQRVVETVEGSLRPDRASAESPENPASEL